MSVGGAKDRARWLRAAVLTGVVLAVGLFYLWIARTSNRGFYWKYTLGGYYNYLSRGFLNGHLYLPIEPAPELLALPNPWDPKIEGPFKVMDLVFFNRHYYQYHGAGPAVMLFVPWRLIVGHDVDEPFAAFLFCFGGFLFCCAALLRILRMAEATPSPALLAILLLALGLCQAVPYLLNRVFVYEIAIAGGYFCISAAVYFLARANQSRRRIPWLAAAGLMFGLAISCRPHLGLAGAIALAGMALSRVRWRELAAFLTPFCLAGLAVAMYNYARFGDPFEFGIRYLFAGENQQRIKLSLEYLPPGLYFMLFCAPSLTAVFPWVRQVFRSPFDSLTYGFPHGYFIEQMIGALYLAPFLAGALWIAPRMRPDKSGARNLIWMLMASAGAILLFLAATGFSSQRYQVDFLPLAVLATVAAIGIHICRSRGWPRVALSAAFAACVIFGVVTGAALGIAGPYDDLLKNRAHTYLRVARWFSPIEEFRPLLNPRVAIEFNAELTPWDEGLHEPLVTMGHQTYRYFLYIHHVAGKLRLVSHTDSSEVAQELDAPLGQMANIRLSYDSGRMTVQVNGRDALVHEVKMLMTAPAQITVGENRIDPGITAARFRGRIQTIGRTVGRGSLAF